jgi:peptidoglycan/LPS O-acetylase OafA/YrhL
MFFILDRYWIGWLLPFLIVLFYLGLFLGRLGSRFVTHPAIYIIGGMCYTLYLYHVLIIKQLGRWTFTLASPDRPFIADLLIQVTLLGALILVLGAVLFKFFERPFMGARAYALDSKSN